MPAPPGTHRAQGVAKTADHMLSNDELEEIRAASELYGRGNGLKQAAKMMADRATEFFLAGKDDQAKHMRTLRDDLTKEGEDTLQKWRTLIDIMDKAKGRRG